MSETQLAPEAGKPYKAADPAQNYDGRHSKNNGAANLPPIIMEMA
jgi:hypothetical protein